MGSKVRDGLSRVVIGLGLAAAMLIVGADADRASEKSAPTVNPHWSTDGCATCHGTDGKPQPIARDAIDQQCLSCHDGIRATDEGHSIGRTFESEQLRLPEGWPTIDGRLGCVTCHDIRGACDRSSGRPGKNRAFLRHDPGPDILGFCGQCHEAATGKQTRYNPHIMLDEQGKAVEQACRFCHRDTAGLSDQQTRTGDPKLRTNAIMMCVVCHSRHMDYFDPGHVGQTVEPDMLSRLAKQPGDTAKRTEASPTSQPANPTTLRLPLDKDRRVVCSTCHNPHQVGVFPADSALSSGATQPNSSQNRLPLRGLSKGVCRACHHN